MFLLHKVHDFDIATVERMMPWEKLVYIDLIQQKMKEDERDRRDEELWKKDAMNLMERVGNRNIQVG